MFGRRNDDHGSREMSSLIAKVAPLRGRRMMNNAAITEKAQATVVVF